MLVDKEDKPVAPTTSSTAEGDASGKNGNRKRRMSKRERKNLKKRNLGSGGSVNTFTNTNEEKSSVTKEVKPNNPSGAQNVDDASSVSHQKCERTLEEYMEGYVPAPLAKESATVDDDNSKSLGKWFPKASLIKSGVCYSNDYLAKLAKERKKMNQKKTSSNSSDNNGVKNSNASTDAMQEEPKASLVLFYQYVSPTWSQAKVSSFLSYLTTIAKKHRTNIGGRIRVSFEGVNATVSAASTANNSQLEPSFEAAQTLRHFTQDLKQFDPVGFANTDFKFIDGLSADRHFKELKLLPVKELVFYGIREGDCAVEKGGSGKNDKTNEAGNDKIKGGIHLDAKDYHEMLKRKDAVVIDVRNHYEAAIGRFDGQMEEKDGKKSDSTAPQKDANDSANNDESKEEKNGNNNDDQSDAKGAEYIDPKMRKSTDFTSWLAEPTTKQKLEGKTVMMFCTGGIRCERASAYLNSQMGSQVNGVYQLQGGIERYLQAFPEGGYWRGKNFVFDKREAIGAGNVNGDGGVVRKDSNNISENKDGGSKKKRGKEDNKLLSWGTECAKCQKPWDRYIGKRKCYTCGVPVLVCDTCMSQLSSAHGKKKKKKKGNSDENDKKASAKEATSGNDKYPKEDGRIRCPLCVEEGVTVPAKDVEYTDNGVRGKLRSSSFSEGGGSGANTSEPADGQHGKQNKMDSNSKAAKSVLKWGGGHATKKKEKRKFSRRPCQFGVDCVRKDCFFYHPERDAKCQKVKGK
mmetsp:Transcript_7086/g.12551  ORF Transcript_7086/g.12551 Transcript_7086/m.12551 type:complete len:743 (-) Transcript_7086:469-2697(-)|eukprot:CAMPEP_0183735790 /NCGR_PEP_ID=MMETSP0737-20130205/47630_1 /TAXON_ID=385413 /ORGANISM="Thalassiosira miniscula, Strain CCMP1093" /LENGTH=742 /DNA_ID=CAMNT_0025969635 /DNA_START=25 /DNA_END=2253 /DNA_ORIENTATION=+